MNLRKVAAIATSLVMFAPLAAFASVNVTTLTLDGAANTTADIGSTVNGKVTYDITSNEDVESLSYELVGSGLPETCVDIPDQIQSGTFHPTFDIETAGATAGTWDVKIRLFGVDGSGSEQLCQDSHEQDSMNFSNRIAITESGNDTGVGSGTGNTGSGNGTGSNGPLGAIMTALQAIIAKLTAAPAPAPVPTGNAAKCAAIAPYVNAPANTYSPTGVQLQSALLLDNPNSIPALAAGATIPMGYFGPQTHAALYNYQAVYGCH